MTPYRFGPSYAKFSARPVDCSRGQPFTPSSNPPPSGDGNYLREDLIRRLSSADACFSFEIQPRSDPAKMPIEAPTVEWDEAKSPFVTVADIRIPAQTFASPAQQTYCENLSFTPWHAIAAHEPVGGINRVRRAVYQAISTLRHSLNDAPRAEPTQMEAFN